MAPKKSDVTFDAGLSLFPLPTLTFPPDIPSSPAELLQDLVVAGDQQDLPGRLHWGEEERQDVLERADLKEGSREARSKGKPVVVKPSHLNQMAKRIWAPLAQIRLARGKSASFTRNPERRLGI